MSSSQLIRRDVETDGKITRNLLLAVSMAVVGSTFQFGYNTGVINAPQAVIQDFFNETFIYRYNNFLDEWTLQFLWGFTVAIFAVGGMLGSLVAGWAAEKFGLKKSLALNNFIALVAALFMGLCKIAGSFEMLIIGRFLIGVNCGINMGIAPMYLTEIAPVKYRGIFGTLGQFGVVTSLLLSQILGLKWLLGTELWWPLLLAVTAAFSLYQLMVLPFCAESPRHLLLVRDDDVRAGEALRWLRGDDHDITSELGKMKLEVNEDRELQKIGFKKLLCSPQFRLPLTVAVVMQLSQQLSGINAVFYYSTGIFEKAGLVQPFTALATVGMGVVNVIMTAVSMALIEKAGRRVLHLVGLGGMFVAAVVLAVLLNLSGSAVTWATVAMILVFVIFFQSGPGSIPWFITTEIFDQNSRPAAVSIAGVVNWAGNFAVALAYPSLEQVIGGYTFVIFSVLLLGFFFFTYFKVPETKGKEIGAILNLFSSHRMQYSKSTKL